MYLSLMITFCKFYLPSNGKAFNQVMPGSVVIN